MRCGVRCLDDVCSRGSGRVRQGGDSVVSQPHGRQGQYPPPLPLIAPSGGWEPQASQWLPRDDVPYRLLRQQWPWPLLTRRRQTVKPSAMKRLVEACDTRYREGVVTHGPKGDGPARAQSLARYLAQ